MKQSVVQVSVVSTVILCWFAVQITAQPELPVTEPDPNEKNVRGPDPNVENVRELLGKFTSCGFAAVKARASLMELGEDAFPAFELILNDPMTKPKSVSGAMYILAKMKCDRRRFIEPTIARLADTNAGIRSSAAQLLAEIGSERDTAPLLVLLSDEDTGVGSVAAEALAAIGGKRDLLAMDVWLKTSIAHRNEGDYLRRVRERRDALEKRLKVIPKDLKD